MGIKVPTNLVGLLTTCYRHIFPEVHEQLEKVKRKAYTIPNEELKTQAIASIESKTFHCEGGSVYATLAGESWKDAIEFIVAYQSISDYLDNLCDRSQSLDPEDFRKLHVAMEEAISPNNPTPTNYYEKREDQNDDGYLDYLVKTCQNTTAKINHYERIYPYLKRLAELYIDLQVHKHVKHEERVPRLTDWYERENEHESLTWYEFAAAAGSTLGIFCLVSYALNDKHFGEEIVQSYFPYVQGLHILLDYYIDQKEDLEEGDLNFCFYYDNETEMMSRLKHFISNSLSSTAQLPDHAFHQLIQSGLVGLYLSDDKSFEVNNGKEQKSQLLNHAGRKAKIIYWNARVYRKWKRKKNLDH